MNKLLSIVTIFIYLAAYPHAYGSIVLCIGDDGHSEIEFAIGNQCADISYPDSADLPDATIHEDSTMTLSSDHCGDCEDIQVSSINASSPSTKLISLQKISTAISSVFVASSNFMKSSSKVPYSTFHSNSFPPFLKKIILRL